MISKSDLSPVSTSIRAFLFISIVRLIVGVGVWSHITNHTTLWSSRIGITSVSRFTERGLSIVLREGRCISKTSSNSTIIGITRGGSIRRLGRTIILLCVSKSGGSSWFNRLSSSLNLGSTPSIIILFRERGSISRNTNIISSRHGSSSSTRSSTRNGTFLLISTSNFNSSPRIIFRFFSSSRNFFKVGRNILFILDNSPSTSRGLGFGVLVSNLFF